MKSIRALCGCILSMRPIAILMLFYSCGRTAMEVGAQRSSEWILPSALCSLAAGAAFVFNDVFDASADRIGGRRRPIAAGVVSRECGIAAVATIVCVVSVVALSYDVRIGSLIVVLTLGGLLYSPVAKYCGEVKNTLAAILVLAPIALSVGAVGGVLSRTSLFAGFALVAGRELLMDVRDSVIDRSAGRRSLAIILGAARARAFGWSSIAVGVCVCISGPDRWVDVPIVLTTVAALVASIWWLGASTNMLRLTMLLALEYVVSGRAH